MVSLKQLETAVSAVEDINRQTIEFELEGTRFVLRAIRPSEDMEVLNHVRESLENIIQMDWLALKSYSLQQRLAVLSFVIIRMGDLDLSGEYLDTGETTEEGIPIQTPKAQALREHMSLKWSASLLEAVFAKYTELVMQLNERILFKVDNEKLDEQISRLREQLSTLERLKPPTPTPNDVLQSLIHRKQERRAEKEVLMPPIKVPASPPAEPKVQPAPTPEPVPEPEEVPKAKERAPVYPREVFDPRDPLQRGRMAQVGDPLGGDSFMDSSDPEQAIAVENARQQAFHQAQQQAAQMEIKARAEARARAAARRPQMGAPAPPMPEIPTFRIPTEDLSPEVEAAPMVTDQPSPNVNPRFMPRR